MNCVIKKDILKRIHKITINCLGSKDKIKLTTR